MIVKVWLHQTSQPIIFEHVTNAYQKGMMYCIYQSDKNRVTKFPINSLFRVEEEYHENQ